MVNLKIAWLYVQMFGNDFKELITTSDFQLTSNLCRHFQVY